MSRFIWQGPWGGLEIQARDGAIVASRFIASSPCPDPGPLPAPWQTMGKLPVALTGTGFQQAVWQALAALGWGATTSYGELARQLGCPSAARAVAGAVARNPVPVLLPCHRVVRRDGRLGGYLGGLHRKQRLLAWEKAPMPELPTIRIIQCK